jgi:hypothetical protein
MNGAIIFGKTPKGLQELAHRTAAVPQKLRSVLILVDGKTRRAELLQRCSFIPQCDEHLAWLEQNGYIEAVSSGKAAVADLPAASTGSAPMPAPVALSPRKALLDLAQELLGAHAGAVVQRLQDTDDQHDALAQTLERCYKLIRLSIDEKKAEQFRKAGTAMLANARR